MRVERLVIEAGQNTFTLDLHPRLTVVAGLGRVERESLVGELIGALGGSRPGVHVELAERNGRHLAVFRPPTGPHRVIDVDRARDVTAELSADDGSCDLLRHLGLDSTTARRAMRFGAADLAASSRRTRAVEVLAGLDQRRVWDATSALSQAEGGLTTEAGAIGSSPEDAAIIEEVEARHIAAEQAAEAFEATRKRTCMMGGVAGVAVVPGTILAGSLGLLFVLVAVAAVGVSLLERARLNRADQAEEEALAEAGASSYLGFQIQRVNGLLANDASRKAVMNVADARRLALAEWQQLAADIPVDWALEHREEIQEAARLRQEVHALDAISGTAPEVSKFETNDLAHALVGRLAEVRSIGGEGLPLILDDPFRELDPSMKPLLLELLGRSAGEPQIIFLTDDEHVASWARLEALTGEVALIEPAPEHDEPPARPEQISI
jgi:hypothetical protein